MTVFELQNFFLYTFCQARVRWALLCLCRLYLIDVWIRIQRAAVTSRRATNLAWESLPDTEEGSCEVTPQLLGVQLKPNLLRYQFLQRTNHFGKFKEKLK